MPIHRDLVPVLQHHPIMAKAEQLAIYSGVGCEAIALMMFLSRTASILKRHVHSPLVTNTIAADQAIARQIAQFDCGRVEWVDASHKFTAPGGRFYFTELKSLNRSSIIYASELS